MTIRSVLVAVSCIGAALVVSPLVPAARGTQVANASYLLLPRPEALVRDGAVLTLSDDADDCARHGLPVPGRGGVVIGLASCDPGSVGGGGVQLERVFEAPYRPTILTLRIAPPVGVARSIQSLRRNGRARIRFDGRAIWEARAASDDGTGHYAAIAQPDVVTTVVIRGRAQHTLRFEVEQGVTWNIASIEIRSDPAPRSIKGIAYSPYRDCQVPGGAHQPTAAEIEDDMVRIIHSSTAIRTYSVVGVNAQVVAAAEDAGLPVYAGAWLDGVRGDEAEIDALIQLARTGRPAGYIVGNEFYLRHQQEGRAAVDYLLAQIRRVRSSLPAHHAPVMTADVDGVMFQWGCEGDGFQVRGIAPDYEPILDATDAILVHIYPFWTKQPITGAAGMAAARYVAIRDFIQRRYPGKPVILGETGWPSAGAPQGAAVPGRDAQRRYMAEFMQLADARAIDYFYFDAFDEGWKIEEPGHVGQHWGYADATRAAKYDISGALIPAALLAASVGSPAVVAAVCGEKSGPTSGAAPLADAQAEVGPRGDEVVYTDWQGDASKLVPDGWMGDIDKIQLFACDRSAPHGGDMAIRAGFSPDGARGWAGVAWQAPVSNAKGVAGLDLRRFDRLSFWVKGDRGGEVVEFQVGGAGTPQDAHRDTLRPARSSGPLVLSGDWQPVAIALGGGDRRGVISGFAWIASRCQNPQPITFFLDDIRFEAGPPATGGPSVARTPFYVYDDEGSGCGHFAPSGFMGDISDVTLDTRSTEAPFKGRTAIQVSYHPSDRGSGWAGVYWQEPEHNWGTQDGGYDLSWASVVTFHARGRNGGEVVEFLAGGMGKARDRYHDSLPIRTTGPVRLTKDWRRYAIDLRGTDRTRVAGGFAFSISSANNPDGAEFFLDEIAYERQ
jgi:exo-beta-1,3-glucanase (GH17 family)